MEQSFCGWLLKAFLVPKFPDMKCESFLYNNVEHSLRKKKEHTRTLFFFPASILGFVIQPMLY